MYYYRVCGYNENINEAKIQILTDQTLINILLTRNNKNLLMYIHGNNAYNVKNVQSPNNLVINYNFQLYYNNFSFQMEISESALFPYYWIVPING